MKCLYSFLFYLLGIYAMAQIPNGFIEARTIIPDLNVELRYLKSNNFIGRPVEGYVNDELYLTKPTVEALKLVQDELKKQSFCLKVYDGYRPQRAVDFFVAWAKNINDTINKKMFYPNIAKQDLFKLGYIAYKSGHSRGSSVDVTLVDINTGSIIDMGSTYDFFGKESGIHYKGITKQQKANRKLLQKVMLKYGFRNYAAEWWHFTLINEPFPRTYFDFIIE